MNMRMPRFFVPILVYLLAFFPFLQAQDESISGASIKNGGFEAAKVSPWKSRSSRNTVEQKMEIRSASDSVPAAEGNQYLAFTVLNKDQTPNEAALTQSIPKLNLDSGRLFRVTWKARSRSNEEFNRTSASFRFATPGNADARMNFVGKREKISAGEWCEYQYEVICPDDAFPDSLDVILQFSRESHNDSSRTCEVYVDDVRVEQLPVPESTSKPQGAITLPSSAIVEKEESRIQGPIPVRFRLEKAGEVTLVIENEKGVRVRNLISAEKFDAGEHVVGWDGLDEGSLTSVPGSSAQEIKRGEVKAGTYRVRGLVHDPLKLTYEFTAYPNCGNPPWITNRESGTGGWLADHGVPTATAFVPADRAPGGKDQIVLAAPVAEAGQALAWVDFDGNKLAGRWRLGGHWTGASHLARDLGPTPHSQIYLYTMQGWTQDKNSAQPEVRLMGLTREGAVTVGMIPHAATPAETEAKEFKFGRATGLAVFNGLLVYSVSEPGRLYFYDTTKVSPSQEATAIGEVAVENPQGVVFTPHGRLIVISGTKLMSYAIGTFPDVLQDPRVLVDSGLEEPRAITVDAKGNLYVADWGNSHQVKVFAPDGKFLHAIGRPGKPATGPFDAEHLNYPYGLSVASDDRLWVAGYRWRTPKTISVWKVDGQYVRSFYGPSEYGGGGTIDSENPDRFLYSPSEGGVEFSLNWAAGKAAPSALYWLRKETPFFSPRGGWQGPMFPRKIRDHHYITNEFGGPTRPAALLTLWQDHSPNAMKPLVFIGGISGWENAEALGLMEPFAEIKKADPRGWFGFERKLLVCWTDQNRDGCVQKEEVQTRPMNDENGVGGIASTSFGDDFEILITHDQGVLSLKPRSVDASGMPEYRLEDARPVASGIQLPRSSGGGQALWAKDGTIVVTGGPMYGIRNGEVIWTYHSLWPSLHAGHAAPKVPEYSGQLMATTRLLGPLVQAGAGEAGQMWAINSDKGMAYLLTTDGLYVDSLFKHPAEGQRWDVEKAERGMDVTAFNYFGEAFWPTITSLKDGRVLMVVGKQHSSIVQIHGLESVKRFTGETIQIGEAELAKARDFRQNESARVRSAAGTDVAKIPKLTAPLAVDGALAEWPSLNWLVVGKGMAMGRFNGKPAVWTAAALAVDRDQLYVALRTRKKNLLKNSGTDLQTLFNTGGGLDLQLATQRIDRKDKQAQAGDVRLVISEVGKKTVAAIYRAVVPGTEAPVVYESPVGRTQIDRIEDISDQIKIGASRVTLTAEEAGAMQAGEVDQIEIAIPLSVIGWDPDELSVTTGDVGVLMGRPGTTDDRTYWHNQNAGIVNDIPSEARLTPDQWGRWEVSGN